MKKIALPIAATVGLVVGAAAAQAGVSGMNTKLPRVDAQQTRDAAVAPVGHRCHDRYPFGD